MEIQLQQTKILFNLITELLVFSNYLKSIIPLFQNKLNKSIKLDILKFYKKLQNDKNDFENFINKNLNKELIIEDLKKMNVNQKFIDEHLNKIAISILYTHINKLYSLNFSKELIKNIHIFETQIMCEYDTMKKYTSFHKLLTSKNAQSQKNKYILQNIKVFKKIPINILEQINIVPYINLNLKDILYTFKTQDIITFYNKLKNIIGYSTITNKIINSNTPSSSNNTSNNELPNEQQQQIFNEVRNHVEGYGSTGLNTALGEVIDALNNNKDCNLNNIVAEGTNSVTSDKVMNMAGQVADKLSNKIQSGEVKIDELVGSSKSFINDIINSEMFKSHPSHKQVEDMFTSLLDTVTKLSDAHQEDESSKGVDEILEKYI
jgi:hypothetical protein